ncbi:hypothetical protein [Rhizobium ruizarguesonis]|uniref:hypothetical protein n=1 Tax=Rhizobium ruizarguesonis TaxID=2081791 RepID=UPI001031DEB9|nr:hypothetical protein [Rhizobium ruizarguesonis]NKL10847.1 hypothetical protein [Rhizobium leguminosarum bv. viciae]NEJ01294.1 hypothetical protein [Rhizobium ruizarguesonis]NEJ34924.1 hypothetical protein [Rhizobium ruizarguesonis]TAT93007.1 hypothetical protein ELI53_35245 [Rhizobium ruizarguesonis]TAZ05018.1 hypothetical protein ELH77_35555 [Rhizobium ruizarguesonis]
MSNVEAFDVPADDRVRPQRSGVTRSTETGPFLQVSSGQIWTRCRAQRDECYNALVDALNQANIQAQIIRSEDWMFPAWIDCDVWMPSDTFGATRRFNAKISFTIRPHVMHDIFVEGTLARNDRITRGLARAAPSWTAVAADLVQVFQGRSTRPPELFRPSFERWLHGLWKRDRYIPFKEDPPASIWLIVALAGAIPGVGAFVILGAVVVGLIIFLGKLGRNRLRIVDLGRPAAAPRQLTFFDTWHVVLRGLGHEADTLRSQVASISVLTDKATPASIERIWHSGPDGLEARDQIVFSYRRALVFVHVVACGSDLYVGWDSHLNRGCWSEQELTTGTGSDDYPVKLTSTVAAEWHLSNLDFADLNTLSEAIHRTLVRRVTSLSEEHSLDQEIDFEIIHSRRVDQDGRRDLDKPLFRRTR